MKLRGKNYDKWLVTLNKHIDDKYVLEIGYNAELFKKLNLTEMIYMNWLNISYDEGVV